MLDQAADALAPRRLLRPDAKAKARAKKSLSTTRKPEKVVATIRDFVNALAGVPTEVLLSALQLSNGRKGTIMPDRKLSAAQGIAKAKPHIKKLTDREEAALTDVAAIRAQVKDTDLNEFDEKLDELVNGKK